MTSETQAETKALTTTITTFAKEKVEVNRNITSRNQTITKIAKEIAVANTTE